jgi:acyl-CoA synthetase (AMP-forming)/AMP-acid ligase II
MIFRERLHAWACHTPDAIAIHAAQGTHLTFQQWEQQSEQWGQRFAQAGIMPGDRVVLMVPLGLPLYLLLAALWQRGAVVVVLNPAVGEGAIAAACEALQPRAWLASGLGLMVLGLRSPTLRRIPVKIPVGGWVGRLWQGRRSHPLPVVNPAPDPDAVALISLTSGSTGPPKLIHRTHRQLHAQGEALAPILHSQPGDRELAILPLFGLVHLAAGGTLVLPPFPVRSLAKLPGRALLRVIHQQQISRLIASPTVFATVIKAAQRDRTTLPHLRQLFIGGAPVSFRCLDHLQAIAPHAQITIVYGATEVEPIATQPYADITAGDYHQTHSGHGLLVGHPVPGLTVAILNPHAPNPSTPAAFTAHTLPPGQPGEILVTAPHVIPRPEPQQFTLAGQRWHRTGDLGYCDRAGRLWLLGRRVGLIEDERGRLYPWAVEAVVNEHPAVVRSAVVGWQGQRLLYVQCDRTHRRGPRWRNLRATLAEQLTWAQCDRIIPIPRLPVEPRHHAKIDYRRLYQTLQHSHPSR